MYSFNLRTEHWSAFYRASVLQAASPKNRRKARAAQARHTAKTMSFILSKDHLHTTPGIQAFLGLRIWVSIRLRRRENVPGEDE